MSLSEAGISTVMVFSYCSWWFLMSLSEAGISTVMVFSYCSWWFLMSLSEALVFHRCSDGFLATIVGGF